MGSKPAEVVATAVAIPTSYGLPDSGIVIQAGGSDEITVEMLIAGGLSSLSFRFLVDDHILYKVDAAGNTVLDEINHDPAVAVFAFRLSTKGVAKLEIQPLGNVAGTITSCQIVREGSDNTTPANDLA